MTALIHRRAWGRCAAFALFCLAMLCAASARAQLPSGTARILVGFPAGGGTDVIARLLADRLKDEMGLSVIVENKPGAGGQLAAQALKAAAPDGMTVMLSHDHTVSIIPLTIRNPGFDSAKDFVAVAGLGTFVNALALSGRAGVGSFNDYLASVRAAGGKGSVGVPAPASLPEFSVKALADRFKLDLVPVPYRGSAPMIGDMLGGQITAGTGSIPDFIEHHKTGRLKVVAVMGSQRDKTLPEVPTFAELGVKGFEEVPYYGLFAPAGTPRAALDKWSQALTKVLARADVQERLTAMGITVGHMSGEQLTQRERSYAQAWAQVIKASGFVPQ
jgi:tripartite-type tricarboxylate transporter receptor subunit TctC